MSSTERKAEIERRLRLAMYPRRNGSATDAGPPPLFTDENDHNPLVLEDCPECHGRGKVCNETAGMAVTAACAQCDGLGTTTEVVPCFSNDAPEQLVVVDEEGFVTCPGCRRRFSLRDRQRSTGRRHRGCGQRIVLRSPTK